MEIAFALIGAILIQSIGCATIPKEERAYISLADCQYLHTNADFRYAQISGIDGGGWAGDPIRRDIRCGSHTVRVKVSWSNGYWDETDIDFEAVVGEHYVVYVIELRPGQDPSSVIIKQVPALAQILVGNGPLALFFPPPMPAGWWRRPKKPSRPFDGCCFIWIEEVLSREVVAGNRPGRDLR